MPTSTVENYLKAIFVRSADAEAVVSTGAIAEALGVTPGTITTMVKSLAARGLLEHQPREGFRLTPEGRAQALAVVRKHRLVETFLVQVLKMDWKEVHEEAEALEHAISDRVLLRIDAILGHPSSDPHGDPIPGPKSSQFDRGGGMSLATCEMRRQLLVERILDQSPPFLEFIQKTGLKPGARVCVRERDRASGIARCQLRNGETTLGLPEAAKIVVRVA
jgi:DtxR family transcriptional regulator, Mn-dependent transcriptional regulator